MAKKKNKASPAASDAPAKSDAKADAKSGGKPDGKGDAQPVDVAYRAGNYSAVRQLAAGGDPHAVEIASRVTVDPQQILIGAITLFVVAVAAFFTLR